MIEPFCNADGFSVSTKIFTKDACVYVDFYVIIAVDAPNVSNTMFSFGGIPIETYFGNIEPDVNSGPAPVEDYTTLAPQTKIYRGFRYRIPMGAIEGGTFTFPFVFKPVWYFPDVPWRVYVFARSPLGSGLPDYPNMNIEFPTSPNFAGNLLFNLPYYPIVGSANISAHLANITQLYSNGEFNGRGFCLMLLPDASGQAPVLTMDQSFDLGIGDDYNYSGLGNQPVFLGELSMSPGAKIVVKNNALFRMSFTTMKSCSQLSKGIVVESGGTFEVGKCSLNDAELAVQVNRGGTVKVSETTFLNNSLGLKLDNTGSTGPDLTAILSSGTASVGNVSPKLTFVNNGGIKPGYPGMPTPASANGWGIETLNLPLLFLDGANFGNLDNGIYARNSSLRLGPKVNFRNMTTIQGNIRNGWSVYAEGTGAERIIYVGQSSVLTPQISSAYSGIRVRNMSSTIRDLNITANNCIVLSNCRNLKETIASNKLYPSAVGIEATACLPLQTAVISDNLIQFPASGAVAPNGTGIRLLETALAVQPEFTFKGWQVERNKVYIRDIPTGIMHNGSAGSKFKDNTVTFMENAYDRYVGFRLSNGYQFGADCNHVERSSPVSGNSFGAATIGFRVANVGSSSYTCNKMEQTNEGMRFNYLCNNTKLKGSEYDRHGHGLYLNEDVTLGSQGVDYIYNGQIVNVQDNGNKWKGGNSDAYHAATSQDLVLKSSFGVDPAENSEFKPANNWVDVWFRNEPTPSIPSFTCNNSCSPIAPPVNEVPNRDLDRSIADGSIHTVGLPGVLSTMLENRLYARLQTDQDLLNSSALYATFKQTKDGSNTGAFYQIGLGIQNLDKRTETESAAIEGYETTITTVQTDLDNLQQATVTGSALDASAWKTKTAQLSGLQVQLRNVLDAVRTRQLTLANQLLTQNAGISTSATWEQNEQTVNDLTIREFIQNNLTETQLSQLDQIGMQCPWSGGDAVFRAQNLYNLYIPKEYDMYAGCTNLRDEKRANKSNLETSVYPNPTTGIVNIDKATTSDCQITVFDVNGRVVFNGKAVDNKIDLSDLVSGTYFLNRTDLDTGLVNHTKIVILK